MVPKISVIIEKNDDYGHYAYCPELEGCQSQGNTLEKAMAFFSLSKIC